MRIVPDQIRYFGNAFNFHRVSVYKTLMYSDVKVIKQTHGVAQTCL